MVPLSSAQTVPLTGVQSPASPEEAPTKCTFSEEVSAGSGMVIVTGLAKVMLGENSTVAALGQGLTLVHFSAQRRRFLWIEGYTEGLFWGYLWGVRD